MNGDPNVTEYVYLIGSEGSPIVKIGRSIDVPGRLTAIQFMSPLKLTVLWQTEGGAELESALHRWFKACRSHGEWFDFPDGDAVAQVIQAIAEMAAEEERKRAERRLARKAHKARRVWKAPRRRRRPRVRPQRRPAVRVVQINLETDTGQRVSSPASVVVKSPSQYRQVTDVLRREILSGGHDFGALLPNETDLAKQLGVARATINQALSNLRREGLVRPQRGIGTTITYRAPLRRVRNLANDSRSFRELICSRAPGRDESMALGIDEDQRIVAITRTTLARAGRAIEVTELMPAHRVELHSEWSADQWLPESW